MKSRATQPRTVAKPKAPPETEKKASRPWGPNPAFVAYREEVANGDSELLPVPPADEARKGHVTAWLAGEEGAMKAVAEQLSRAGFCKVLVALAKVPERARQYVEDFIGGLPHAAAADGEKLARKMLLAGDEYHELSELVRPLWRASKAELQSWCAASTAAPLPDTASLPPRRRVPPLQLACTRASIQG